MKTKIVVTVLASTVWVMFLFNSAFGQVGGVDVVTSSLDEALYKAQEVLYQSLRSIRS